MGSTKFRFVIEINNSNHDNWFQLPVSRRCTITEKYNLNYRYITYEYVFLVKFIILILVMADQSQNPGTPGTSNQYPNWSQSMNWSYGK